MLRALVTNAHNPPASAAHIHLLSSPALAEVATLPECSCSPISSSTSSSRLLIARDWPRVTGPPGAVWPSASSSTLTASCGAAYERSGRICRTRRERKRGRLWGRLDSGWGNATQGLGGWGRLASRLKAESTPSPTPKQAAGTHHAGQQRRLRQHVAGVARHAEAAKVAQPRLLPLQVPAALRQAARQAAGACQAACLCQAASAAQATNVHSHVLRAGCDLQVEGVPRRGGVQRAGLQCSG